MTEAKIRSSDLTPTAVPDELTQTLNEIQNRVLWLSMQMIHHANFGRLNPDGTKVGGHQASSASMVSIMTALYFHYLRAGDRVSVKPHASPVFHAIQYLLGRLPKRYLTELRSFQGLQSYPSRTKDPDEVDFSTGSVGLGAVAPAFAALAHHYALAHFGRVSSKRFVAIIGDAELDEGNVWEAILDPALAGLGNLLWIVDLNRQSLDRVVPGIRARQLKRLFAEGGWQVLEAKYGRVLQEFFARPGGHALRRRIDEMSNEEYQSLIRLPGSELRPRLVMMDDQENADLAHLLAEIPDDELPGILSNLGGHDLVELMKVLAQVDEAPNRPSIIFAYTIKGWHLPIAGHPLNHSMLLTQEQMKELRTALGIRAGDEWERFPAASAAGQHCAKAASDLYPSQVTEVEGSSPSELPDDLPVQASGHSSTQQTFGRLLMSLSRIQGVAERIVTAAPDVSTSTNLSGWVVKTGLFGLKEKPAYEGESLSWRQGPEGQHIELGISEMNLFMMLSMFGLSAELIGQPLIPIGTVYDPFIARGLDAFIYALYSGAKFILAGTPSGITLSPEGGAHQSSVTPSLGAELPNLLAYEPCFAQELAWILLEALAQIYDRKGGRATYLRLSTKPIDQQLMAAAMERFGPDKLRQQVLAGGYRLIDWRAADSAGHKEYLVHIATCGAMVPEAVEAAHILDEEGIPANVINLTSPRALFEAWKGMAWGGGSHLAPTDSGRSAGQPFDWLIPGNERYAPIVTVHDGASHALAWLGSIFGAVTVPLGVDNFGQSGTREELYQHYGIGVDNIVEAALYGLNRCGLG